MATLAQFNNHYALKDRIKRDPESLRITPSANKNMENFNWIWISNVACSCIKSWKITELKNCLQGLEKVLNSAILLFSAIIFELAATVLLHIWVDV